MLRKPHFFTKGCGLFCPPREQVFNYSGTGWDGECRYVDKGDPISWKGKKRKEKDRKTKRRRRRKREVDRKRYKYIIAFLLKKQKKHSPPPSPPENTKADRHNESGLEVRRVNEKGNGERDPTRLTDVSLHKLLRNNLDCPFPA